MRASGHKIHNFNDAIYSILNKPAAPEHCVLTLTLKVPPAGPPPRYPLSLSLALFSHTLPSREEMQILRPTLRVMSVGCRVGEIGVICF